MTAFTEKLDRAAGAATCAVLQTGGSALIGAGAWGVVAGGAGFGAIGLGAAAVMASQFLNCDEPWDPTYNPPGNGGTFGCIEKAPGTSNAIIQSPCNFPADDPEYLNYCSIRISGYMAIGNVTETPVGEGNPNSYYSITATKSDGTVEVISTSTIGGPLILAPGTSFSLYGDGDCLDQAGPDPGFPPVPPYQFTDVDGCQLTVNFEGFASTPGGVNPVYKITPDNPTRSELDPIGGCNFAPVIYMGDPAGGPPFVGPWDPDWDGPDQPPFPWGPKLDEIAEGISGAATKEDLKEIFESKMAAINYRLDSICEIDAEGNPVSRNVQVSVPALDPFSAIAARIDALVPLLQGQKDFKQPICSPVKPEGEFRTIGFISDEVSPNGKSRLVKRFRYRSLSGLGLDAVIDYWKDFQFNAGPVIVQHRGASWGSVKCWAASADEGKRVIRHAAGEAGINADQVGRWEISGSSSSRLGMPGTMKVNQSGGYYWITARDGSDNRPLVGKT